MRTNKSDRLFKQSNQFISPHSVLLQTRTAIQQRLKEIRTTRPISAPNLVKVLSTYSSLEDTPSPFLPTKYRSGHSNPYIDPAKVRWRAPTFQAQARAVLCKQAFHWRILRHIFNLSPNSIPINDREITKLPKSTQNLLHQKPNFYDGSLTIDEFKKIKSDPVPKLVQLFGGQDRLSCKDKRLLGLLTPPKDFIKSVRSKPPSDADSLRDPLKTPPRYLTPTVIPHSLGPYLGRRKIFKGKVRQRNRESKNNEITQKMIKMDDRVQTYRKDWRVVKQKSKPALPF